MFYKVPNLFHFPKARVKTFVLCTLSKNSSKFFSKVAGKECAPVKNVIELYCLGIKDFSKCGDKNIMDLQENVQIFQ